MSDNLHNISRDAITPELEARLLALLNGEASDFEADQLEQLLAVRPEVAVAYTELQQLQQTLIEVGQGEATRAEDAWKLSPARREKLLGVFSGQVAAKEVLHPVSVAVREQRKWNLLPLSKSFVSVVAVICVVGIVSALSLPSVQLARKASRDSESTALHDWRGRRGATAALELDTAPFSTGETSPRRSAGDRLMIEGSTSMQKDRLEAVKGQLQDTLDASPLPSPYYLYEDTQYLPQSAAAQPSQSMPYTTSGGTQPSTAAPGISDLAASDSPAQPLSMTGGYGGDSRPMAEGMGSGMGDYGGDFGTMGGGVGGGMGGGYGGMGGAAAPTAGADSLNRFRQPALPRIIVTDENAADKKQATPSEGSRGLLEGKSPVAERWYSGEPQNGLAPKGELAARPADNRSESLFGAPFAANGPQKPESFSQDVLPKSKVELGKLAEPTPPDDQFSGLDRSSELSGLTAANEELGESLVREEENVLRTEQNLALQYSPQPQDESHFGRAERAPKAPLDRLAIAGEPRQGELQLDFESTAEGPVSGSVNDFSLGGRIPLGNKSSEQKLLSRKLGLDPAISGFETRPAASQGIEEVSADEEAFSTFSLHVSDVSFKLAWAALSQGQWPQANQIRIEEFVNAFDYGDPLPNAAEQVACQVEQAVHPFQMQRNLLRVSMRTAASGRSASTPLRLTLLLDNSGSMERADRRQTLRRAFEALIAQLKPADQVTLISFADRPRLLVDRLPGDQAQQLLQIIDTLPSEGGTNIETALQLALEKASTQTAPTAQNRVVLLTDGAVNLGDANPERLSKLVTTMRDTGIAFDAAGISSRDLNDEVLEALTRQGDGRYYLLDAGEDAAASFADQLAGALRPTAKNVKVQIEFNPQRVGQYKLLGFEKHRLQTEDFRNDQVDAAEMAAAEAGVAVYQFEAKQEGSGDIGSISVRFRDLTTGLMVERTWPIPYQSHPPRLEQASSSLRIAAAAAFLAAKLKGEPVGDLVTLPTLAAWIADLPAEDRSKLRVQQLQSMLASARRIESGQQ